MRERLGITVAALGLTLALGACGGGGEASTTTSGLAAAGHAAPRVAPLRVSAGGSAQFHVKGADNSIEEYGSEAGGEELRQAAKVVHGYFAALATEDWGGACSRFSRKELSSLAQLAASSPKLKGKGCAPVLAELFGKVSLAEAHEATVLDAASLRRQGAQGFLIYRGAGRKPYFASLKREGGRWTVHGLSPTPLP